MLDELRTCLDEINKVIEARKEWHGRVKHAGHVTIYEMMDTTGRPILADLLVAKANLLGVIASLEVVEA